MTPFKRTMLFSLMTFYLAFFSLVPYASAGSTDYYEMDDNAITHFHKGQSWMEVRQYDAAIREFQIAIRLKPNTLMTASLYNNLGLAYLRIGEFPKAIVSFQEAISLNPNFSLFYENLAKAYQKSGALDTAISQLNQTVLVNPEDTKAWYLLGVLNKTSGNTFEAQNAFTTFIHLVPNSELTDAAKLYVGGSQDSQNNLKKVQ